MFLRVAAFLGLMTLSWSVALAQDNLLPFDYQVESYRNEEGEILAFALRLEQPFLAEEFEKSSYLRLKPLDENSYLVYPRETKFQQKHAEFFGRLRGEGTARLRLSYETVSENLDGSRKVDVQEADIEVSIPETESGPSSIYKDWATEQNRHFIELLRYYPEETFFEYALLQSKDRYGVAPPPFETAPPAKQSEESLYYLFSGGLAVQQTLQRQTLAGATVKSDLDIHISELQPPAVRSPDYEALLSDQLDAGLEPHPHELAELVPIDQYFLQFNSMNTVNELTDLSLDWGTSLLRMFTITARDHHLREKYERQLCVRSDALSRLFADHVIGSVAFTGSDFFIAEGTDLTLLLKLREPDLFEAAAAAWLADVKEQRPDLEEREFNYRGHKVLARYTTDRIVSSFIVRLGDKAIVSNSHVGVRKIIDTIVGEQSSLASADDYRYLTTLLPPTDDENSGYLYCSDAFLRRLVSPAFKIGEKRRLQALNHLVMLNNASLMYRMEHGHSPAILSELVDGQFVNPRKIVCPQGGAYAFDAKHDTSTSSVFNRIKYLTPLAELQVLKVSRREKSEYERYKQRYEAFWRSTFDPIAMRVNVDRRVTLEMCVLPFANSSVYADLRRMLDENPQTLDLSQTAESAVTSVIFVPGREKIAAVIQNLPGVNESLEADPTLTDLSWIGDRCSVHFCDDDSILEIDPTQLRPLNLFIPASVFNQSLAAIAVAAMNYPAYLTFDVEDEEKAARLLEGLASSIFLQEIDLAELPSAFDAYRVPDYKGHPRYVVSYQLYAAKLRFHVGLVHGQLVAATRPHVLSEVIDAADRRADGPALPAHAVIRLNLHAMKKLQGDLGLYWAEKSRQASHRNIMPIYNLIKLYGVSIDDVNELADAKYGVTYFCPDGEYRYDADRDQVYSTVYGNRQHARQNLSLEEDSSFSQFLASIGRVTAALRFSEDALFTTVEIDRLPQDGQ